MSTNSRVNNTPPDYGQRVFVFSLGFSCGKQRRDSEDVEDVLLVMTDGLADVSPPHEFQARVDGRNARPVAHLHRGVEAVQAAYFPADGPFFFLELFDRRIDNRSPAR